MFRRHLRVRIRLYARQMRRFIVHHLLHADDPPHKLALGFAIGVFITFTPTVGFQMGLVVFFAWLLRANKIVGVPLVWITNPATIIPIYYPMYRFGCWLLGYPDIGMAWWKELASPPEGWWPAVSFYWTRLLEIAAPLWLGSTLVALALAIPSYFAVYFLIRTYRLRRWGQIVPPGYEVSKRINTSRHQPISHIIHESP